MEGPPAQGVQHYCVGFYEGAPLKGKCAHTQLPGPERADEKGPFYAGSDLPCGDTFLSFSTETFAKSEGVF